MEHYKAARARENTVSKISKLKAMAEAGNTRAVKTLCEKQERHVVKFNPKQTIVTQAEASSVISYAQKVKDWPALEKAVAIKIEEDASMWRGGTKRCGRPAAIGKAQIKCLKMRT